MAVTVLFLVIFEAQTDVPEYKRIEKFLVYQCLFLVADLLFFLFRSSNRIEPDLNDGFEPISNRFRRMSCTEISNAFISLFLYLTQITWLIYGNYLYFNLH